MLFEYFYRILRTFNPKNTVILSLISLKIFILLTTSFPAGLLNRNIIYLNMFEKHGMECIFFNSKYLFGKSDSEKV